MASLKYKVVLREEKQPFVKENKYFIKYEIVKKEGRDQIMFFSVRLNDNG